MSNIRELIRARAASRKIVSVFIPELGEEVRLQSITYGETKDLAGLDSATNVHRYLARMIIDEKGQRVYSDDDSIEIDGLSPDSVLLLSNAAKTLNGATETTREAVEKNSEANPNTTSVSS